MKNSNQPSSARLGSRTPTIGLHPSDSKEDLVFESPIMEAGPSTVSTAIPVQPSRDMSSPIALLDPNDFNNNPNINHARFESSESATSLGHAFNQSTHHHHHHHQQQQQQQQQPFHYSHPQSGQTQSGQQQQPQPHSAHFHTQQPFFTQPHGNSFRCAGSGGPRFGPNSEPGKRKQSIIVNVAEDPAICAAFLSAFSVALIFVTLPFSLFFCIKVVQEYERAVIFRLGRLVTGGARGPGIFFIIPCIDTYSKVDLRTVSFDVPPQEILSKDSVTVAVDAVVYFRISNAIASVSNVEDYARSTRLLAATTLRNVLGTKNLSEILSERESISHMIQSALDEATDSWGVKVERVEVKDARLPFQLQRAMAAEAEAAREARAKVIAAEGEQRASKALKEAAEVISASPAALQLRYLQTLNSIAAEKNSTIVFPVPMELFSKHTNCGSSR